MLLLFPSVFSSLQLSNVAVSAKADAIAALFNNGYLRIYDGVQPINADTAIAGQLLLAELRFAATAFNPASNGVALAPAVIVDAAANATGTATWFRALRSNGTTVICDGSVGISDADINLDSVAIVLGEPVPLITIELTAPKSHAA